MMLSRRGFCSVLFGAIAAPLIVPRANLMAMPRRPFFVNPVPTGYAQWLGEPRLIESITDDVVKISGLPSAIGDVVWMRGRPMLNLGNDLYRTFNNWHDPRTWSAWRVPGAAVQFTRPREEDWLGDVRFR